MVKNKFVRSVVSVLLCASIVFAGSFVSQVLISADNNSKTFNFDETVKTGNDIGNSAFTVSADQNHGNAAGKSLKIERTDATTLNTSMGMLLTTKGKNDGDKYQVEWNKTYKVTLYYKTVGTAPSDSWMLGVATGPVAFNGNRTAQSVSNPLMLPKTATDWTKYETTFKATGSGENKYLGLTVEFPKFDANSGYAVYIDDVTVEETDTVIAQSGTKTFDFGLIKDNISGYANSAFSGSYEANHGNTASGKSVKIYKDSVASAGKMGAMLTLKDKKDQNFLYNVEWGKTYKVTLWYKTVGTASFEPWQFSMYTNYYDGFSGGKLTKQTLSNSLSFPTTATDWTKFEATFTAASSNTGDTALGIGVEFPAFGGNTGDNAYAVYIDDVTVEETKPPMTFDFDESKINSGNGSSNSSIATTDEAWRGDSGKSLRVYKESSANVDSHKALLTTYARTSGEMFNVEWGKTYKVTLWYKTVGNAPQGMNAWELGLYTCKPDVNGYKGPEQSLHAPISFQTTASGDWIKAETTFTAAYSAAADADKTSLGLIVKYPVFSGNTDYKVYIDDVTVEETDTPITPPTPAANKTFDFENSTIGSKYYNSSSAFETTDEAWRGTASSGKSLKVYKDKIDAAGPMRALLTTEGKSTGEKFNVEWGKTYKVTLWYKTVGTAPSGAWSLGLYTCYPSQSTSATAGPEQSLHTPVSFRKTASGDEWIKAETTFTAAYSAAADADKTSLGLIVNFPAFGDNTGADAYTVYIDDVTVEETDAPAPVSPTTKSFGFEGTIFDSGCANSAFSITDDVSHGDSGKSLMVYKSEITSAGYQKALLTTAKKNTGEQYRVEWGKTYKVTFYYKTVGTAVSTAWALGLCTGINTGFAAKVTQQTLNNRLYFPTTATDWTKFETTFTAAESDETRKEDYNYLGISVNFPAFTGNTDYKLYIDDVTVEETDPPIIVPTTEKIFDFESTVLSSGIANSAFTVTGEQFHGDAAGGKSIKVYKDKITTAGQMKFLLTTGNQTSGERYNVEWGKTYKIKLWYKTVGTAPSEVWTLGVCTGLNTGFAAKVTNQLSSPVYFETTATNGWVQAETTFTAVENNPENQDRTWLGLSVNFPVFSNNTDYAVYIDDVSVEEIETPTPPAETTTKSFDFETTVYDSGSANTAFTISGEDHHGTAAYGKSLRIYKDSVEKSGKMSALLTTGTKTTGEQYNVEWGKSYKVTLWYKTVGTLPGDTALKLRMYTNSNLTFSNPYKLTEQSMDTSLSLPMTATDGWVKYEGIFTAFQPNKDYIENTHLGIGAEFPIYEGNTDYKVYIDDVTVELIPDDQVPEKIIKQGFEDYNYLGYGYYYDRNFEIYNSSMSGFDPKNVAEGSKSIHSLQKVKSKGLFSIMTDNYYIMDGTSYYKLSFMVRADSVGAEGGTIKAVPLAKQTYTRTADEDFATSLVDMSEIGDGRWYKVTQVVYAASYYYLGIQTPGDCSIYIDDIQMRKVDPGTVVDSSERVVAMSAKDGSLDNGFVPDNSGNGVSDANGNTNYPRTGDKFPYVVVEIAIISAAALLVSAKSLKRRKSK